MASLQTAITQDFIAIQECTASNELTANLNKSQSLVIPFKKNTRPIHIDAHAQSSNKCNYMNMLESSGAVSIIIESTRKTSTSQTTLDHRRNDNKHQIVPGIFQCNISDYFPVFCKIDINHKTNITKKRCIKRLK